MKITQQKSCQTDHKVISNKPDITVVDKINKKANLIEVAVPNDYNICNKCLQKIRANTNLSREIKTLWNLNKVRITPITVGFMETFYNKFDDDISKRGLTNHNFGAEEAQKIALLGTAHIVRSFLEIVNIYLWPNPNQTLLNFKFLTHVSPLFHVTPLHTVSIILCTPFEQFDTRLVWNLKFHSALLSWCVFNSHDITEAPDQTDCIHNMKAESVRVCFDTFYLKVIPTVKFNPKRFFFKEQPTNYFHYVFSTLTLPHQHEDENNLKTHHERETYICFYHFMGHIMK